MTLSCTSSSSTRTTGPRRGAFPAECRSVRSLRCGPATSDRSAGRVPSVPEGRSASRALPPLSALPPQAPRTVHCGGGPSPAPWQSSSSRDGAVPGAGDPAALRRLEHVRHGHPWRLLRASRLQHKSQPEQDPLWWLWRLWCGQDTNDDVFFHSARDMHLNGATEHLGVRHPASPPRRALDDESSSSRAEKKALTSSRTECENCRKMLQKDPPQTIHASSWNRTKAHLTCKM